MRAFKQEEMACVKGLQHKGQIKHQKLQEHPELGLCRLLSFLVHKNKESFEAFFSGESGN